ncbi:MAG TPA: putative porin [Bacteroidales bacterium]|nr:putative porin [Bacteroidales bacterium]
MELKASSSADTLISPSVVPWFTNEQLQDPFDLTPNHVDTSIIGFQHYDFSHRYGFFFANKGNVGHATRFLKFSPYTSKAFSPDGEGVFQGYRFEPQNLRFYRPRHVFTEMYYVTGANREQLFYAMHNQKFTENLYAGLKYQVVNSPGAYNHMASRHSNVSFTIDFRLPNNRYQVLGSFISNRRQLQESGGLENHLDFETDRNRDIVLLPNAYSRSREMILSVQQFYQTGFYVPGNEGANENNRRFINLGRINHEFSLRRSAFVFDDPSTPVELFPTPPANTDATFDSSRVSILENLISWSNFPLRTGRGAFPFNFRVFLKHSLVNIRQPSLNVAGGGAGQEAVEFQFEHDRFSQIVQGADIETDQTRFFSARAFAHMTLGGYHDGDFALGGSVIFGRPENRPRIFLEAGIHQKQPPYLLSRFRSNYISWDNDFSKQFIGHARARIQLGWMSAEANYYLLNNMVFIGSARLPVQNANTFSVFSAALGLNAGLGPFRTRHQILYQHIGNENFEQFPELVSYHSAFFDFSLFRRAMNLNLGVDVYLNTAYHPMGFLPMLRQFYSQTTYRSNNSWIANGFATIKVQRTRFFIQVQNVGSMLPDAPVQYQIPFYPLPGMAIKFGISWMFFD